MTFLTREELEKLPTKRILAYKKKYFYSLDALEDTESSEEYRMIKEILSKREHVEDTKCKRRNKGQ